MKKNILLLMAVVFASACQKNATGISTSTDNLLTHKLNYSRLDTTQSHLRAKSTQLASTFSCTLTANYNGSNSYAMTVNDNVSYVAASTVYTLYQNGTAIESESISNFNNFTITRTLTPGTYYFSFYQVGVGQTWTWQTPTLTIVAEPAAPAGMICLFRYFNSASGQHICTYDWEELGSTNVGYSFEKVLGYTYPSASSATNLKPIYRYYKSSDGSHFTTDLAGTYSGFVFEKILGYVGTAATATLSRSLTKYYRSSDDDHFVCVAPDVPNTTGYTQDIDFVFGYLQ